ncbi:hypothetical protein [Pseudoflavonifractor phocaeensis]|uniref:hypothetical protein n=1 Tax=Pseudoflavonifractor phocaeensis TaxID=1870988 RepID=UPI00195BC983|nr:hypothetical protein [Pseudoflavonifractor phocaeensis]MBM6887917.1 hypothetical protein [Pseudoflavonifractor phocaeensis]
MLGAIVHNKKFEVGEQIDCFKVTAPLPFAGGVATFGESEVVDLPHIDWGKGSICFVFRGIEFQISLNCFEPVGVDELLEWCIEDFDDAEIDWIHNVVLFTYTTTHQLPKAG